MTATKHFHLIRSGKPIGAFPEPAIQLMLDSGRLEPDDLCWAEGMAEWRPVSARMEVPEGGQSGRRSGWASAAGWLGVLAVGVVPAPLAVVAGVIGLVDIRRSLAAGAQKSGTGRAIFGLLSGMIGSAVFLWWLVWGPRG